MRRPGVAIRISMPCVSDHTAGVIHTHIRLLHSLEPPRVPFQYRF